MTAIDFILCDAYLALMLTLGWLARGKDRDAAAYFLAGRGMGWLPVGLSVMVSVFSAVNYAAYPAEVANFGLYVLISLPVFVLVAWPITRVVIPLYQRLPLINAYGYFERRFDPRTRRLASGIFLLWRLMWMATALYACGQLLAGITEQPAWVLILLAGGAAIAYTALGGLRAVMWTDVAQFGVMLGSIVLAVGVVVQQEGGLAAMFDVFQQHHKAAPFTPFDPDFFSFDPRIRITFWSGLLGTFVAFLARYGADQMILQRYLSARSPRAAAQGFWLNVITSLIAMALLTLLGVAAHVHASQAGQLELSGMGQLTGLLKALPAGVTGIVVAGLLAAAMSSLDSGLNACVATWSSEFTTADARGSKANVGRRAGWLTVTLGVLVIGLSFAVGQLGTLFAVANRVINGLGSPLLALFLVALLSRRVTASAAFWGGLVGTALSIFISFRVEALALHYYAVVNLLATLIPIALLTALGCGAPSTAEQLAWTWRGLRQSLQAQPKGEKIS